MFEYLLFTCPRCGSHELLRADRSLAFRKEHSIRRRNGNYLPGEYEPELADLEPRGLAGLRCAQCMYPDTNKLHFSWKTWEDVAASGCLSPDPAYGKEKVACTVCALDGRAYRANVMLQRGEVLSPEQRQQLLERVLNGQPGVVLCERDTVINLPDMPLEGL